MIPRRASTDKRRAPAGSPTTESTPAASSIRTQRMDELVYPPQDLKRDMDDLPDYKQLQTFLAAMDRLGFSDAAI